MTTKTDEQERARFKAHYEGLFDLTETTDAWGQPKFAHEHIESIWAGWKARAALQSQDREDAERLDWLLRKLPGDAIRYCVGVLDDTADAEEFRAAIDHARRVEGEASATK